MVKLAKRFEVSRRTINRDIEDLCMAGIPIVTSQGANGGISIMENYKIDKTLFSHKELTAILAGLCSLDSIVQDDKYRRIMDKFSANKESLFFKNNLVIDLSSHYRDSLAPKINLLTTSIENTNKVTFTYYNKKGEQKVTIDPYLIVFQWSNWYVLGMDNHSLSFKLYKLNRISELDMLNENFLWQEIPQEVLEFNRFFSNEIQVTILFDASVKYRLIEEYGLDCFKEEADGRLLFSFPFTNQDYLLSWVLSFGAKAEVIEPVEMREAVIEEYKKILNVYGDNCKCSSQMKLPAKNPITMGTLTKEELDAEIRKGIMSIEEGRVYSAETVEAEMRRDFGV